MYNNTEFPAFAQDSAKHWKCSKCQETFANYRELGATRAILMPISQLILNSMPYDLDIPYCPS